MATLSHLPPVQSLSSSKHLSTHLPIFHHKLHCCSHQNLPRICASLTKKSRASRKLKSDEELRRDIKEFLSVVGLPQDHVPSTKELSQHGRQDLANIVRRRGYKFIRELLAALINQQSEKAKDLADDISLSSESTEVKTEDLIEDVPLSSEATVGEENTNDLVDDISLSSETTELERQTEDLAEDVSLSSEATKGKEALNDLNEDVYLLGKATAVAMQTEDLAEDVSLLDEATKDEENMINLSEDVSLSCEATVSKDNITNGEMSGELKLNDRSYAATYPSSVSLHEKVTKFVQEGELDDIEDSGYEILKENPSTDSTESTKLQDVIESKSNSVHGMHEDLSFSASGGSDSSNGHITSSCQPVEHPAWEIKTSRAENLSNEKVMMVDHNEDLDVEQAQKADNQAEISYLKYILHQKELELTKLKEQIEKEKHALSILQTKAQKEINEAQKLISAKDAELHTAEESLSGLKEVEIQYQGEGEIIEVAGSFNGWHQRIKMDPLPSSSISDLTGLRKSRLWRTVLWLYPGVYEIKFISDGHWTIDPQRESVTRGSIHNNILRVDRQ